MTRKEILNHLIKFDLPLNDIQNQLADYEWESEELILFKKDHLRLVLKKYVEGLISSSSIEQWANIIECREDISYFEPDSQLMKEIIYILANPDISERLTKKNACKFIEKLR